MKLINVHDKKQISTAKFGKQVCTILEFEGERTVRYGRSIKNIFAYKIKSDKTFTIYEIRGNSQFSLAESIPLEVIQHIAQNNGN